MVERHVFEGELQQHKNAFDIDQTNTRKVADDDMARHSSMLETKRSKQPVPTKFRPQNWLCQAAGGAALSGGSEPHAVGSMGAYHSSQVVNSAALTRGVR